MGGANLHTPQSVFQHMMGQKNSPQQTGGPWLQIPQVPALSMPWSIPALQQPDLIRFTGERSQPTYGSNSINQKRKLNTPDVTDTRQVKQFITEEKMASHFQGLRISSNYRDKNSSPSTSKDFFQPQSISENLEYVNSKMESTETVELDNKNNSREPRLVISEELKRMKEEPLIPVSLISKLERPSMALVLWEPPSKHLARVLPTPRETVDSFSSVFGNNENNGNNNSSNSNNNNRTSSNNIGMNSNQNNNNNNNNNNNSGITDLNQSSTQLEPMEL